MRGWLLDTNVVSELHRPRPSPIVADWLRILPPERSFISVLTLAELDQGIERLDADNPNISRYISFRHRTEVRFKGRTLSVSDPVVRAWGVAVGRRLRTPPGVVPAVDALIAITAVHHRLHFATRNIRDVVGLGASVFNPWTDDPAAFPIEGRGPGGAG